MFFQKLIVVCGLAALAVVFVSPTAFAQGIPQKDINPNKAIGEIAKSLEKASQDPPWEQLREPRFQKEDDVECTAEVWGRSVKRLGKDMIEFKVKVTTKTIGRNRTGRGYATFAVIDSTDKPILTLQVEKYSSTSVAQKEHEESEEKIATVGADTFWNKWNSEICQFALTSRSTAKVDFPLSTNDGVKWFKDNISPEIAGAISKLRKLGAGEKVEQGNWSIWNVKKGKLK